MAYGARSIIRWLFAPGSYPAFWWQETQNPIWQKALNKWGSAFCVRSAIARKFSALQCEVSNMNFVFFTIFFKYFLTWQKKYARQETRYAFQECDAPRLDIPMCVAATLFRCNNAFMREILMWVTVTLLQFTELRLCLAIKNGFVFFNLSTYFVNLWSTHCSQHPS